MTVRRLDPVTGDIVTYGTHFISGREEVAQTIRTRLKLFLGEYFRDITDGTPWFQSILGKGGSLSSKDAVIKRRIAGTKNVVNIVDFSADYDIDSRKYTVSATVMTTYGQLEFSMDEVF